MKTASDAERAPRPALLDSWAEATDRSRPPPWTGRSHRSAHGLNAIRALAAVSLSALVVFALVVARPENAAPPGRSEASSGTALPPGSPSNGTEPVRSSRATPAASTASGAAPALRGPAGSCLNFEPADVLVPCDQARDSVQLDFSGLEASRVWLTTLGAVDDWLGDRQAPGFPDAPSPGPDADTPVWLFVHDGVFRSLGRPEVGRELDEPAERVLHVADATSNATQEGVWVYLATWEELDNPSLPGSMATPAGLTATATRPPGPLAEGTLARALGSATIREDADPGSKPLGTLASGLLALVLENAQGVDRSAWTRIQYFGALGSALHPDTIGGWVLSSALTATNAPCPPSPTLEQVAAQPPFQRLVCYEGQPLTFPRVRADRLEIGGHRGTPKWLANSSRVWLSENGRPDFPTAIPVHVEPDSGVDLPTSKWLSVTGHFDHPASAGCTADKNFGGLVDQARLWCRQQFVLTATRPVEPPDTELRGSWRKIADAPISGRTGHQAVWTGSEMLIWGGDPGLSREGEPLDEATGAAYDPATDRWRVLPEAPLDRTHAAAGAWTGEEMLVWGGYVRVADGRRTLKLDGAAYKPAGNSWRSIPEAPLSGSLPAVGTWADSELVVVEGGAEGVPAGTQGMAAAYDPNRNRWRSLPTLEVPTDVWATSIAWTGTEVVVLLHPNRGRSVGFALELGEDAWRPLFDAPLLGLNTEPDVTWTGSELVVVSFAHEGVDDAPANQTYAALYDSTADRWRTSAAPPEQPPPASPVWANSRVIWASGVAYDPAADHWLTLPAVDDRPREFPSAVWTGSELVVWGGSEGESVVRPPD